MLSIADGKIMDPQVESKLFSNLEMGAMDKVNAIVVHQTGGSTASGTLSGYANAKFGAHFLLDKDGTIYQTARVNRWTQHVGHIRSRCFEAHTCTAAELKAVKDILFEKGKNYSTRIRSLSEHEKKKTFPERYPMNSDSIGIEVAGAIVNGEYEVPTPAQSLQLKWLIRELLQALKVAVTDVYRHPGVSYKEPSEAKALQW